MIIIPGFVIAIATFPGVIVHEAAHMLFCRLRGVAIFDVCFFRVGNPAGYVIHEPIENFNTAFLVDVGPLFVNSLLCLVFCFPAAVPYHLFQQTDPLSVFLMWLGVSIGMHAFPSNQDAQNLWAQARREMHHFHPLAVVSFPLVLAIYVANLLRFFWFDAFYAMGLGLWLPAQVLKQLF